MAATFGDLETAYDDAVTRADRAFHDILVEASGNSALLEMLPVLSDRTTLLLEMRPETRNTPTGKPGAIERRRRILQALRDGDADAVVAKLTRSLEAGRHHLLGSLAASTA
jgi:DNA-binding GntR family transcriptional regulator